MLRALLATFAMWAVGLGPCAGQTKAPVVDIRNDARNAVANELPTPNSNSAAGAASNEDSAAENELLEAANKSRELAGVPPLRVDESLRLAARAHARRMVAADRLEHQLPGEPGLLERIAQVISPDIKSPGSRAQDSPAQDALKIDRAGENIANATCALGANDALMRSAPHRQNLLDRSFNVVGIATIWSKGRLYVVQDFAHELPSYSAEQSRKLIGRSVDDVRQQAGLPELEQLTPPHLDEAACKLAKEDRPNVHLLAAAYSNRKIVAYTESRPETLPSGALRLVRDPSVRQFAVGSCYARNAAYPTGMYWVAILLY